MNILNSLLKLYLRTIRIVKGMKVNYNLQVSMRVVVFLQLQVLLVLVVVLVEYVYTKLSLTTPLTSIILLLPILNYSREH